jgi:hypothetical protein
MLNMPCRESADLIPGLNRPENRKGEKQMRRVILLLIGLTGVLLSIQCLGKIEPATGGKTDCVKWTPGHYVLPTRKFGNIDQEGFIASLDKNFKGLQIVMTWRELEPEKDRYDFKKIENMLAILNKYDKQLFLQIAERSFKSGYKPIPDYLYEEPEYEGGAEPFRKDLHKGSVARIWNPNVLIRFNKLLHALGNRFDGDPAFEGLNFPETAIGIDYKKARNFSKSKYLASLKQRLYAAKQAFPHSVVIQYVNYLAKKDLEAFIRFCYETGIGIGGPDLVPDTGRHKHKARIPAYQYYPSYAGKMPFGMAVQSPNFTHKKGVFTLDAFWDMGIRTLKLNYIFWNSVEGKQFTHSFSRDIAPYIKKKSGKINTVCPENIAPCCP